MAGEVILQYAVVKAQPRGHWTHSRMRTILRLIVEWSRPFYDKPQNGTPGARPPVEPCLNRIFLDSRDLDSSFDLNNDFALGAPLSQIFKRLFGLRKWKHLVDHWPDALRLEELADFGELIAIGARKEK